MCIYVHLCVSYCLFHILIKGLLQHHVNDDNRMSFGALQARDGAAAQVRKLVSAGANVDEHNTS